MLVNKEYIQVACGYKICRETAKTKIHRNYNVAIELIVCDF